MDFSPTELLLKLIIAGIPLVLALTLPYAAQAWMARRLGDHAPAYQGRLSLNPVVHADLWGSVIIPLFLLLLNSPFLIGWGKPISVNPRLFANPRRDIALYELTQPAALFVMAAIFTLLFRFTSGVETNGLNLLPALAQQGVMVCVAFCAFNLLPLPPYAGGRVLQMLLPPHLAYQFSKIEPYSFYIFIALAITGLLWYVLIPVIQLELAILSILK
mgnify:CR=1 FL=1